MDHTRILPKLFLGSCPETEADVGELKQAGITGLLNLQTEEDFLYLKLDWPSLQAAHAAYGIEVRRVPILDGNWTDLEERLPEAVNALAGLLEDGRKVYVHCNSGLNRAPTTVIAYMNWLLGWGLEEAERHVRSRHACDPKVGIIQRIGRPRQKD